MWMLFPHNPVLKLVVFCVQFSYILGILWFLERWLGNEIKIFTEFCNSLFNSISRTRESDTHDKITLNKKRNQNNREMGIIYTLILIPGVHNLNLNAKNNG